MRPPSMAQLSWYGMRRAIPFDFEDPLLWNVEVRFGPSGPHLKVRLLK